MDDEEFFFMKWLFGVVGAGIFIFIGYVLNPDDFTTVLGILIGAVVLGITMNQWGKSDKL